MKNLTPAEKDEILEMFLVKENQESADEDEDEHDSDDAEDKEMADQSFQEAGEEMILPKKSSSKKVEETKDDGEKKPRLPKGIKVAKSLGFMAESSEVTQTEDTGEEASEKMNEVDLLRSYFQQE